MQAIYSAENIIEAYILKGYLEQRGITVHVSGYYLQGGIGELPVSGTVQLWVANDEVEHARRVLDLQPLLGKIAPTAPAHRA